jgi:DNA repair protein RecN (Recombination protein N)
MLTHLSIKNVVLITTLTLDLDQGLSALTGETGAGKSILLDSLGLALGYRAEAGLVRKGEDQASVTAAFDVADDHPVQHVLSQYDLEFEDQVILRRTLSSQGRSKAFINDQPVSVAALKHVGQTLVEIHGQFETQGLLDPSTHSGLLDEYAGVNPAPLKAGWKAYKKAITDLEAMKAKLSQAKEDEDYIRQSLEDLDSLDPQEGEEEILTQQRRSLMNRDKIIESYKKAYHALSEENGADVSLGKACSALEVVAEFASEAADPIITALDNALSELQDASSQLQSALSDMDFVEDNLEEIDNRLYDLKRQAQKHDCTIDQLPSKREDLARQLNEIEEQDGNLAVLMRAVDDTKREYEVQAGKVSELRKTSAGQLGKSVQNELPPLKMDKAAFVPTVTSHQDDETLWGASGFDDVRFLVSTNPGASPGPLNKIASGGEMSRFMLALKVIMAEKETCAKTLIFDEVDAGIGGATADAVGLRLQSLAAAHQILVVTHSPQVAAKARNHFIVLKQGLDDVQTTVKSLPAELDRREEIARMLSGSDVTNEARAAAETLMKTGS